jgi:glycosyltransferase involved in cell wall biosynthesis
MSAAVPHIVVCICTFRRPALLADLLSKLERQTTDDRFTYSVVVADNDGERSAQSIVDERAAAGRLPIVYCVQPEANIALARNTAVSHAHGDWIAFIDDDEEPVDEWLVRLLDTCLTTGADGALGPVAPRFESDPPAWVKKGRFFDRPTHPTGYVVPWSEARSGNVLFKRSILDRLQPPFRAQFSTAGEDVDFFRRAVENGCVFRWSNEALAYEHVPAWRCTRRYLLRRAVLRGSNFPKHPAHRVRNAVKSVIAVPCYALALPVLALAGQHVFLKYLIKLLDHGSRLVAFLGFSLVTQRQT